MKKLSHIMRLALVLFAGWSTLSFASGIATTSIAPMLQQVLPTVVNLRAQLKITDLNTLNRLQKERQSQEGNDNNKNNNMNPVPDRVLSVGSGVIVDADKGYIITNAHVVQNAENIIVTLSDGHHYTAKIIGLDRPSDIAVLQIRAKNLKAIIIGNSSQLKVGDFVAAIGNPFGLNQSVTSGIVSAIGRNTLGIEAFENFIQIDAPINPGNSGGALVDAKGELVGINTAIIAPDRGSVGIGFAIPSNLVKSVMQQLIEYGNVKRGMLGIGAQDMTPDLASAFGLDAANKGAVVTLVMMNSPAQKAGLQIGDIITAINGTDITNANDVVNAVGFSRVNSKADITLLRKGKTIHLKATLTDPKQREEENVRLDPFLNGVTLKNFSINSPIHGNIKGILVVDVAADTNAWRSDLRPGDVITMADHKLVTSVDELKKIASGINDNLLLNIHRGNGALFIVINRGG